MLVVLADEAMGKILNDDEWNGILLQTGVSGVERRNNLFIYLSIYSFIHILDSSP